MARQPKTNFEVNGYNYYKTSLTLGRNAEGKSIVKVFYGLTKTEAENKKKQYIKDLEAGLNPNFTNQTLDYSIFNWLWNIEKYSGNKSSSFERYEGIYRNYIKSTELGSLTVSEIKKFAIQSYYKSLLNAGKSESQIKNLHKLLNKFFNYAEIEGYIIKNPCKGIKFSKNNEDDIEECDKIIETFTEEEIKTIKNCLSNEKIRYIIMFALLTGTREGEILGLNRDDVQGKMVKINKTLRTVKVYNDEKSYHYEKKITKPKTSTSKREVPIPDILMSELKKLDKLVTEEKLKLGPAYTENNLLFPSETGTYIDAKNLRRSWKRVLDKAQVPYKKFHSLRHTYATRLFENNVSILTVARLLGHSSTRTTEIYTHVLNNIKEKEVECLNNMFL